MKICCSEYTISHIVFRYRNSQYATNVYTFHKHVFGVTKMQNVHLFEMHGARFFLLILFLELKKQKQKRVTVEMLKIKFIEMEYLCQFFLCAFLFLPFSRLLLWSIFFFVGHFGFRVYGNTSSKFVRVCFVS